MALADELLALAEKIVVLKRDRERIDRELADVNTQFAVLVARADHTDTTPTTTSGESVRERLLALPAEKLHVDQIQNRIGETDRKKMLWTLYNLRKQGLFENPSRGFWKRRVKTSDNVDPEDGQKMTA